MGPPCPLGFARFGPSSQYRQKRDEISDKTRPNGQKSLPENKSNTNNTISSLDIVYYLGSYSARLLVISLFLSVGKSGNFVSWLTLQTSVLKLLTVANSRYQLS